MDNIIKSLSDFVAPSGAKSLAELQTLPFGYAKVTSALKQLYGQLNFNHEGLFPCFRVKVEKDTVQILSLAPNLDVIKLLINSPYIQDRYEGQIVYLGSRVRSAKSTFISQVEDGFEVIPVPIEYQVVTFKLLKQKPLTDKVVTHLLNEDAKLLTFELAKQLHFQLHLPAEKFTLAADMNKIYQPLLYTWLNHLHTQQFKGAA